MKLRFYKNNPSLFCLIKTWGVVHMSVYFFFFIPETNIESLSNIGVWFLIAYKTNQHNLNITVILHKNINLLQSIVGLQRACIHFTIVIILSLLYGVWDIFTKCKYIMMIIIFKTLKWHILLTAYSFFTVKNCCVSICISSKLTYCLCVHHHV